DSAVNERDDFTGHVGPVNVPNRLNGQNGFRALPAGRRGLGISKGSYELRRVVKVIAAETFCYRQRVFRQLKEQLRLALEVFTYSCFSQPPVVGCCGRHSATR